MLRATDAYPSRSHHDRIKRRCRHRCLGDTSLDEDAISRDGDISLFEAGRAYTADIGLVSDEFDGVDSTAYRICVVSAGTKS